MANQGDLRVWWVKNPPREAERYPVQNIAEAIIKLKLLEKRDLGNPFVFSNAGGLEVLDGDEWIEYYDEEDQDIDEIMGKFGLFTDTVGLILDSLGK